MYKKKHIVVKTIVITIRLIVVTVTITVVKQ